MQHPARRRPGACGRYACRMSHRLARIVSILGHPLVSLPVAALLLTANQGAGPARLSALVLGLGAIALGVIGYSRWQVRRQRWRHVDASEIGRASGRGRGGQHVVNWGVAGTSK